jgi:outer membrane protein TolC
MKTLIVRVVTLAVVVPHILAAESGEPVSVTPEFISQLAEQMRANNPAVLAARARTNAASAAVGAVRTWDDPMVLLGGMAADEAMRADNGDIIYGLEQKLPLFGKPAATRRVARAELDVSVAREDAEFQVRRAGLAVALFRTGLADETIAFGEEDLRWLDTMKQATEARYRSGEATLTEWLQIQNEYSKRAVQLQTDRDKRTQQHVISNRLLGRPLLQRWPQFKLPPLAGQVRYSPQLVRFASQYEPRLRAMREESRAADAMADLTRRERYPEIAAGVESRNYSGNGEWRQAEFVMRMSLPWFNRGKYRSAVERDEAKARAAQFEAVDYEASLQEEIHGLTVKIEAARREATAYHDEIIPRSEAAIQSARTAWETGRGMFRDVLEARRMLVEARLMYLRSVTEQYEMLSDLVLCCGIGDLEALQMIGAAPKSEDGGTKP